LFSTESGEPVANHGVPAGAMTPAFSVDGRLLAFNDAAIDGGRGLAVMDFDPVAGAASGYRELLRDTDAYPAWPSFAPDASSIIFARGSSSDFSAGGAHVLLAASGPRSDLYRSELVRGEPLALARAMGVLAGAAGGAETEPPFGGDDLHRNYHPQVAPAAAGGYAWVFFDSIRNYGNRGVVRRIWGAAIELGTGAADPSRPPFYLPGQSEATNLRPVPALDSEPASLGGCAPE
jgi:hypothetical protein